MQADGDVERRSEEKRGCCRSFFVDTRRYAAQREERGRERERERGGDPELGGGEGWNVGV